MKENSGNLNLELLQSINDAVYILDKNGNIVQANDTFCKMLGYSISELLQLNAKDYNASWNQEKILSTINELRGKTEIFELLHRRKDGTTFDAEVSAKGISINNEDYLLCITRDITSRKKAQTAIKESEKKFRALFENAYVPILLLDIKSFRIFDCNPATEKLFGKPQPQILHLHLQDFSPEFQCNGEKSDELINFYINQALKGGKTEFEFCFDKDGKQVLTNINLYKVDINGNSLIQVIINDVTEKRKSEEQLKLLSLSINQSNSGIVITDLNGNIEYVNDTFCKLTGYTKEEIIRKNPRILKSGYTSPETYKQLWETITSGKQWTGEFLNKRKDGTLYWESARISPVKDESGRITNFIGIKDDITQLKKLLDEIKIAKAKAEETNRLKTNFLANMSHELRTPLVGILGCASMIAEDTKEPLTQELAKIINKSGQRLHETLNAILDLTRLETESLPVDLTQVDILPLIKNTYEIFINEAKLKGLNLYLDVDEEEIIAFADLNLLKSVLSHLVSNAIKYTEIGGVSIRAFTNENKIIIKVVDTGIGIPDSYGDIIFEPFRQVSEGYNRQFEGSGLGLTLTKKYVKLMNGRIWFNSKLGEGSAFFVELNAAEKHSEPISEEVIEKPKVTDFSSKQVLLVEDDPINIQTITAFIGNLVQLTAVNNADDAIEIAKNKNFDLILMDIGLSGDKNGLDVVREIRMMPQYHSTPIAAVTAYAMDSDRDKMLSSGCTHYLAKPFPRKQLIDLLEEIFSK
ncbi:PAS/PAC domain protein [Ignavibacterium album JCM 16511]|uniref:histidine kinase n=1 Tax=Ignavibacterium album (strain DSM 19864 / JCM 16511 / NBRC 101810 / Mat9-16) TaxID=945713 RepID=I0AL97_IGNAJ|nr:PAS domain-containing hybrid sensor histidine kinase/response regulator [Ignavibacterium album]AFH49754.1 PAS/PAC domain protein [Ignavibacterium album JCM 16511]